ncbi:unnamed protein product [Nyctereutes procyonoides]|uniref:(raccoon dog) hypothetical protein n=1 Tax=Nyctereutes procyonoides TaxID=34880 RepID=A0A811Y5Y4_NYCPR|nr:unnamed protein product [Nyctereutes procyonoides]
MTIPPSSLLEVVSVVRGSLETSSSAQVSIAVTEDSGNSVLSFINTLWGIWYEEETSALTEVVRTTQIHTCYSSHFPSVTFITAATRSLKNYLEEMSLSQYDLFIIIAWEGVLHHLDQAGQGPQHKCPLGRTARAEYPKNILETHQKQWVCEHIIFLVSSLDPLLHDFPELKDTLHKDLSNKIIKDKATSLQKRIASQCFQDTLGIQDEGDLECFLEFDIKEMKTILRDPFLQ